MIFPYITMEDPKSVFPSNSVALEGQGKHPAGIQVNMIVTNEIVEPFSPHRGSPFPPWLGGRPGGRQQKGPRPGVRAGAGECEAFRSLMCTWG